jgi:hypothetical protein
VISNTKHVSLLPPSWGTLHQLALLPAPLCQQLIENETIHQKMERKDVAALVPKPPPTNTATSGSAARGHVKNPTSDVPNGSVPPAIHDIVAPDEELSLLREFAEFVIGRANSVSVDPKDFPEWRVLRERVKAILAGRSR